MIFYRILNFFSIIPALLNANREYFSLSFFPFSSADNKRDIFSSFCFFSPSENDLFVLLKIPVLLRIVIPVGLEKPFDLHFAVEFSLSILLIPSFSPEEFSKN